MHFLCVFMLYYMDNMKPLHLVTMKASRFIPRSVNSSVHYYCLFLIISIFLKPQYRNLIAVRKNYVGLIGHVITNFMYWIRNGNVDSES